MKGREDEKFLVVDRMAVEDGLSERVAREMLGRRMLEIMIGNCKIVDGDDQEKKTSLDLDQLTLLIQSWLLLLQRELQLLQIQVSYTIL